MDTSSTIGDILVGRRKWTDPQVFLERDILLDSGKGVTRKHSTSWRSQTDAFSENSYFHRKKLRLPTGSDDNSVGMEDMDENTDEDMRWTPVLLKVVLFRRRSIGMENRR
ncbi:MAG: hypothetical protein M1813_007389 [Trichoglossum hirsutum]|nr:MAG: hypothetical protein M1813_007389 [Trichoglossum hirsutum]